ncbi:MAG: hypothetical protein DSO00_08300 [Archaeoglobi archaeon]|jgi:hypothetical protein|nr:MAG: hypothetical protein DSN99_08925 [Archaeoglobi archaeon]TDA25768.1 MAG: hypothetical protein DSO00_08300 [Archaeoglobi archaeon]
MSFKLEDAITLPEKGLADEIVEEIAKRTGKNYQELFSMISERQERMNNLVSFEVVALVVAKEYGVDISKYLAILEERIFNETV